MAEYLIQESTLTDIADAIRAATSTTDTIKITDVPAKIGAIALGVYNDGFWDDFQENGERTNYDDAFSSDLWTDEIFTPKYPMNCTSASGMFRGSKITTIPEGMLDTTNCEVMGFFARDSAFVKLPRIVIGANCKIALQLFLNSTNLLEIETLAIFGSSYENGGMMTNATNLFYGCSSLEKITIEGEIFFDINFKWTTKLSVASMQSVITHLKNCADTDEALTHTVTFSSDCWAKLDEEGATAPGDVTWRAYVANLGWNAAEG